MTSRCYEAPFNVLATPIRQAKQMGLVISSRVLDIDSLDLAMGKMMEQGPVLVITFNSQQILCVKDRDGKVVEGSEDKVGLQNLDLILFIASQFCQKQQNCKVHNFS